MLKKFKMRAACDSRYVIQFLNAKGMEAAEVYYQICDVYGEEPMSDLMVWRGVWLFEVHENVHNNEQSGWPSLVNDMMQAIEEVIDRCV